MIGSLVLEDDAWWASVIVLLIVVPAFMYVLVDYLKHRRRQ